MVLRVVFVKPPRPSIASSSRLRLERVLRGGGIQEAGHCALLRTQDPLDQGSWRKTIGRVGWFVCLGPRGKCTQGCQLLLRCRQGLGWGVSRAIDPPQLLQHRAVKSQKGWYGVSFSMGRHSAMLGVSLRCTLDMMHTGQSIA